jgi:predicted membrane metal-binding protein
VSALLETKPGHARLRLLAAALALLATGLVVAIWSQPWGLALTISGCVVLIVFVVREAARTSPRRRRREFARRYNSLDDVRATLDLDELQALRATAGDLHTAREIRRRAPLVSLKQAAEIMRGL